MRFIFEGRKGRFVQASKRKIVEERPWGSNVKKHNWNQHKVGWFEYLGFFCAPRHIWDFLCFRVYKWRGMVGRRVFRRHLLLLRMWDLLNLEEKFVVVATNYCFLKQLLQKIMADFSSVAAAVFADFFLFCFPCKDRTVISSNFLIISYFIWLW